MSQVTETETQAQAQIDVVDEEERNDVLDGATVASFKRKFGHLIQPIFNRLVIDVDGSDIPIFSRRAAKLGVNALIEWIIDHWQSKDNFVRDDDETISVEEGSDDDEDDAEYTEEEYETETDESDEEDDDSEDEDAQ